MSAVARTEVNLSGAEQDASKRPWGLTPQNLILYLMIFPAVIAYLVFVYVPMPGMLVAFTDFKATTGYQSWVGLENIRFLFTFPRFGLAIRNNLLYAFLGYVFEFPAPIILALMFNELQVPALKKTIQTVMTIPHFVNWIVVAGVFKMLFDPEYGWVNSLIVSLGGESIYFLGDPKIFPFMYIVLALWKSIGWGSILYLATMASIDATLYEAASIDGAGRWRQTWHVTLPALKGIILLKLILSFGGILNLFDSMFILQNQQNKDVSVVLDTLTYDRAIKQGFFSQGAALGVFKNIFGITMTIICNEVAKKLSDDGRGIF